jgi:hypothetical protein
MAAGRGAVYEPGVNDTAGASGFAHRLLGALLLRREAFRDVAADRRALGQAAVATILGSVVEAFGTNGMWPDESTMTPAHLATSVAAGLVTWVVPTAVLHAVAKRLAPARADLGALLRATGFAAAPQLLYGTCIVARAASLGDAAAWFLAIVAWLLTQGAVFIGVQETLGTRMLRTLAIFTIAGILTGIVGLALSAVLPSELWQPLVL